MSALNSNHKQQKRENHLLREQKMTVQMRVNQVFLLHPRNKSFRRIIVQDQWKKEEMDVLMPDTKMTRNEMEGEMEGDDTEMEES